MTDPRDARIASLEAALRVARGGVDAGRDFIDSHISDMEDGAREGSPDYITLAKEYLARLESAIAQIDAALKGE